VFTHIPGAQTRERPVRARPSQHRLMENRAKGVRDRDQLRASQLAAIVTQLAASLRGGSAKAGFLYPSTSGAHSSDAVGIHSYVDSFSEINNIVA